MGVLLYLISSLQMLLSPMIGSRHRNMWIRLSPQPTGYAGGRCRSIVVFLKQLRGGFFGETVDRQRENKGSTRDLWHQGSKRFVQRIIRGYLVGPACQSLNVHRIMSSIRRELNVNRVSSMNVISLSLFTIGFRLKNNYFQFLRLPQNCLECENVKAGQL